MFSNVRHLSRRIDGHLTRVLLVVIAVAPTILPAAATRSPDVANDPWGVRPQELRPTPIAGVFELIRGSDVVYVLGGGKFAIAGDLYDLKSNENLSEHERRAVRTRLLAAIPESDMVIFGSASARHTVTVFTDLDCPFCRRLHSQIAEYNRLGIRVRYLFYPRSGPNSASWIKAEQVWCSRDRKEALTRAKRGEALDAVACAGTPVARHYALGQQLGLPGTPAIVLDTGELIPGFLPPEELARQLQIRRF